MLDATRCCGAIRSGYLLLDLEASDVCDGVLLSLFELYDWDDRALFSYFVFCLYAWMFFFFFSSRRRHTRCLSDWSSDVCSSDLAPCEPPAKGMSDSNAPLAISRDGRRVVVAPRLIVGRAPGPKSELRVWDVDTGRDLFRQPDDVGFAAVTLTRDGRLVAAVDYKPGGAARVWDVATGKLLHTFPGCGGQVRGLAFSPDDRRLACGAADRGGAAVLRVWALDTGRERILASVPTDEQSGWPVCIDFS